MAQRAPQTCYTTFRAAVGLAAVFAAAVEADRPPLPPWWVESRPRRHRRYAEADVRRVVNGLRRRRKRKGYGIARKHSSLCLY
jgi:hypothetical protein